MLLLEVAVGPTTNARHGNVVQELAMKIVAAANSGFMVLLVSK